MKEKRTAYKMEVKKAASEERAAAYTRQIQYDDPFTEFYGTDGKKVLQPPFLPNSLYEIYEESGVIQACVEAMVENVDGYGHRIVPIEGSELDLTEEEQKQKEILEAFFRTPNGIESFGEIREKLRRDIEVTGNGYLEVVRNGAGKPHMLFWLDAKKTRLLPMDSERVAVQVFLDRDGKIVPETILRQFRRFAMIDSSGKNLVYFKEFGDPRPMDANTGEFVYGTPPEDFVPASEVIHFKIGNGTYGVPRWIGTILTALGTSRAEYVNFDLFDGQAVPPLIISVSGGELTDESFDDLLNLLKKSKGVKNFHKVIVLEAESTAVTPDGRATAPRIEVQDLMAFRKEDALFGKYLADGRTAIRMFGFRLPGIFIGDHTGVNFATAKISRELAEEQLFIPVRTKFDDKINATILREFGIFSLKFKSDGPVIKSSQDVISIFPQLLKSSVFSMNELVQFTNENFGLHLKPYDGEWADLPIGLLLYLFQALGMQAGSDIGSGKGIPNVLGSMKPTVEAVKSLASLFAVDGDDEVVDAEAEQAGAEELEAGEAV